MRPSRKWFDFREPRFAVVKETMARARAPNSPGDNSREDSPNEDERGKPLQPGAVRALEVAARGSGDAGRQKAAARSESWRFFRGPARAGQSMNLCDNFRQEPNAERSGYYISPCKSAKRGSLSFGRHRRDVTGCTREIYTGRPFYGSTCGVPEIHWLAPHKVIYERSILQAACEGESIHVLTIRRRFLSFFLPAPRFGSSSENW